MKKIIKVLLTISIILIGSKVNALSMSDFNNEGKYQNKVHTEITIDEYKKLHNNYSDELIDILKRETIDAILYNKGNIIKKRN